MSRVESQFYPNLVVTSVNELPRDISMKPYLNVPRDELDAAILWEMQRSQIVGISAAFVKGSQVIWARGYGWADLEREQLAAPDTLYRIASISKVITATALMQLWEQGLFRLDDDISPYLGYTVRNPGYPADKITFRMLLTHTSGIMDFGGYEQALASPQPPLLTDLLVPGGSAYSEQTYGDFRPGTNFVYSNFGFGIIGALVEMISGERFDQYALNHIFRPLGMDASYVVADIINFHKIAVLYKTSGGGLFYPACDYYREGQRPERRPYRLPLGNYYIGPAGAVRSSVLDLAKFLITNMNQGVYNGVRILRKHTVDLMHQMQWFGDGLEGLFRYIGLSYHITDALADRRLTGHPGEACGLVSDMYFDRDENVGVIFMTNGGYYTFLPSGYTNIEEAVINKIFHQLAGPPKPVTRKITIEYDDSRLVVNGRRIYYPVLPEFKDSELFMPALALADAFEAGIQFDNNTNTLTLLKGPVILRAKIGAAYLEVNHSSIPIRSAIYFKDGNIMLPLGTISEAFGASITFYPANNAFVIVV